MVTAENDIAMANNEFGMKVLRSLYEGENIFISPMSISMAMSMVANGADGETLRELMKTLECHGLSIDDVNAAYLIYQKEFSEYAGVDVNCANGLFGNKKIRFDEQTIKSIQDSYGASFDHLDFDTSEALGAINSFVDKQTNHKIPKILEELSSDGILVLVNAIYLKGLWKMKFEEELTEDHDFHLLNGETKKVKMMSFLEPKKCLYHDDADYQVVSLPYGDKESMTMWVILPEDEESFRSVMENINEDFLSHISRSLRKMNGEVFLPKFSLEYSKTLNDVLCALGASLAFSPARAEFKTFVEESDREFSENIYISEVVHKARLDVDESGTVAAASTAVLMRGYASVLEPFETFVFRADKPFITLIRDNCTGTVWFAGAVVDPS